MTEAIITISILFSPILYLFIKEKLYKKRIKKTIIKKSFYKSIHEECVICLGSMDEGHKKYKLYCDHCYHKECIINWILEKPTCPLCNLPLKTKYNSKIRIR